MFNSDGDDFMDEDDVGDEDDKSVTSTATTISTGSVSSPLFWTSVLSPNCKRTSFILGLRKRLQAFNFHLLLEIQLFGLSNKCLILDNRIEKSSDILIYPLLSGWFKHAFCSGGKSGKLLSGGSSTAGRNCEKSLGK